MNRRLTLKRESLTDLTPRDLSAVAGAAVPATLGAYCTSDTTKESYRVCSVRCQFTAVNC